MHLICALMTRLPVQSYREKARYLGCITKWQISQPPGLTPSWHTYMKEGDTFYSTEIRVLFFILVTIVGKRCELHKVIGARFCITEMWWWWLVHKFSTNKTHFPQPNLQNLLSLTSREKSHRLDKILWHPFGLIIGKLRKLRCVGQVAQKERI